MKKKTQNYVVTIQNIYHHPGGYRVYSFTNPLPGVRDPGKPDKPELGGSFLYGRSFGEYIERVLAQGYSHVSIDLE